MTRKDPSGWRALHARHTARWRLRGEWTAETAPAVEAELRARGLVPFHPAMLYIEYVELAGVQYVEGPRVLPRGGIQRVAYASPAVAALVACELTQTQRLLLFRAVGELPEERREEELAAVAAWLTMRKHKEDVSTLDLEAFLA